MKITKHHIVPSSKGGTNDSDNIAYIKQGLHSKYHDLFVNRTPEEILEFLENYFWGGNTDFIADYFWKEPGESSHTQQFRKLFGDKDGDSN